MEMAHDHKTASNSAGWFWSADDPNSLNACLLKAAKEGNLEEVRHLLSMRADINTQDASGWTPIIHAAFHGHLSVVEELISNPFAKANILHAVRSSGATAVHLASARGHSEIVSLLVQAGGNLNSLDFHSRTPLHAAILGGHSHIVRLLLQHKADASICDSRGKLPVHVAQEKNLVAAITELEKALVVTPSNPWPAMTPADFNASQTPETTSLSSIHQVPDGRFFNTDMWTHVPFSDSPFSEGKSMQAPSKTPSPPPIPQTFHSPPLTGKGYFPVHNSEFYSLPSFNTQHEGWVSPPMAPLPSAVLPCESKAFSGDDEFMPSQNASHPSLESEVIELRKENSLLRNKLSELERQMSEKTKSENLNATKWEERELELLERIEFQQQKLLLFQNESQTNSTHSEDLDSKENNFDGNSGPKQRKKRAQPSKYAGGSYMSRKKEWRWKRKD